MKKHIGMTLTELMAVIVIIGVLTMIARPNYQKYVIRARIAEGYQMLGVLVRKQSAFYYEYKEFYNLGALPLTLDPPMTIVVNAAWNSSIGYPAAVGSNVNFNYRTRAGQINGSGTPQNTSAVNGNSFALQNENSVVAANYATPASTCNSGLATPSSLGALNQGSYDWVVIAAVGDLRNNRDANCTAIVVLLDATSSGNPGARGGYVIFNAGE